MRAERLVRVNGVRIRSSVPGWFDYNKVNEHHLVFLQGDTRQAGDLSDGVIARGQIAEILVLRKTFELVAIGGPAQKDLDPLFGTLDPDSVDGLDGVRDTPNQPLDDEPQRVKDNLRALQSIRR